jgi:hypothetical protein
LRAETGRSGYLYTAIHTETLGELFTGMYSIIYYYKGKKQAEEERGMRRQTNRQTDRQ